MIRIPCPFCGPRDHDEFGYEGDASVVFPPLDAPAEAWCEAVYFAHPNPSGRVVELWRHSLGCRAFLTVERDTATHEIGRVALAHPADAGALAPEPAEAAE
jgi:sarcosine oxidase subunit delta